MTIAAIMIAFTVVGLMGMPLAFALGFAALIGVIVDDMPMTQIAGKMVHSIDSFPLMAIPLFMVAGQLMIKGGIMERLIEFANAIVGRVRGGLAHVTILAAIGLSAISGTAAADAAVLAGTLGPSLTKIYGRGFSAAIVAAAASLGPIIPPSAGMVLYAILADTSVGALFASGFMPGLFLGFAMMGLCTYYAYKRNYPLTGEPFSFANLWLQTRRSLIVFLMPVVCIGGIVIGAFTATEGAAIAVVYALIIGFFITRRLKISDLAPALLNAGIITGVVGALIAFASQVTYLFTVEMVGVWLTEVIQSLTTSPFMYTALVMAILLVLGTFMEANATYVMLVPLLAPIATTYGIDPVYFGFLFVMNNTLGGITPPVGIQMFIVASVWRLSMAELTIHLWPFIVLQYVVLVVCMIFPQIILIVPKALGY